MYGLRPGVALRCYEAVLIASRLSQLGTTSGKARTGRVEDSTHGKVLVSVTSNVSLGPNMSTSDFTARENGGVRC